jgi:hypothetical protein
LYWTRQRGHPFVLDDATRRFVVVDEATRPFVVVDFVRGPNLFRTSLGHTRQTSRFEHRLRPSVPERMNFSDAHQRLEKQSLPTQSFSGVSVSNLSRTGSMQARLSASLWVRQRSRSPSRRGGRASARGGLLTIHPPVGTEYCNLNS